VYPPLATSGAATPTRRTPPIMEKGCKSRVELGRRTRTERDHTRRVVWSHKSNERRTCSAPGNSRDNRTWFGRPKDRRRDTETTRYFSTDGRAEGTEACANFQHQVLGAIISWILRRKSYSLSLLRAGCELTIYTMGRRFDRNIALFLCGMLSRRLVNAYGIR